MKRLFLSLLLLFSLLSCEHKTVSSQTDACNVQDPVRDLPWLKLLIEKAVQDKEASILTITLLQVKGRPIFNYYTSYMSCIGCINYDCNGTLIDKSTFSEEELKEFQTALFESSGKKTILWPEK